MKTGNMMLAIGLVGILSLLAPASGTIFMNSTCSMDVGLVTVGQECTFYCEAQDYKENEVLVVTKRITFTTLLESTSKTHTIYTSTDGFNEELKDSGRYWVSNETETSLDSVEFTFLDASTADNGFYQCHTELNGEKTAESDGEIEVMVGGQNVALQFARQRSEDDSTIEEFYGNQQTIKVTTDDLKAELVMLVAVNNLISDSFTCKVYANYDNGTTMDLGSTLTAADTSSYIVDDALPDKAYYLDRLTKLTVPDDDFVMEGVCTYNRMKFEHYSGRVNIASCLDGACDNMSRITAPTVLIAVLQLLFLVTISWKN